MSSSSKNAALGHSTQTDCPFSLATQLNDELRDHDQHSNPVLPGYPRIDLDVPKTVIAFLRRQLISSDMEIMAPRLWWMSKQDSTSISPLHRQLVKKRQIVVTEDPKLHLVWFHDRIFIKPLPDYLMSFDFWNMHLKAESSSDPQLQLLRQAALGYLRTYFFLIQHKSDFRIAQREDLQLLPTSIEWAQFCNFSSGFDKIQDSEVIERYHYGEIRLTRLNFYAKILLRGRDFHRVEPQYAQYFAKFYGPFLFLFGVLSVLLSAMQVEIAVEQLESVQTWPSFQTASRGFSVATLIALLSLVLLLMWLLLLKIVTEWMFALRDRFWYKKGKADRTASVTRSKSGPAHV